MYNQNSECMQGRIIISPSGECCDYQKSNFKIGQEVKLKSYDEIKKDPWPFHNRSFAKKMCGSTGVIKNLYELEETILEIKFPPSFAAHRFTTVYLSQEWIEA